MSEGKERYLEKLKELEKEYFARERGKELVSARLRWENWERWRGEAVGFARVEIGRRRWRGAYGGVLPGCLDAEDAADQVLGELLEGKGRLALGWTGERLRRELKRLVRQKVRSLHRLRERALVRSEWELPGVVEGVGSVLGGLAGERADGEGEGSEESGRLMEAVWQAVDGEKGLREVLGCLVSGVTRPVEIAARLGMEVEEVKRLRKRLDRRLERLRRENVDAWKKDKAG